MVLAAGPQKGGLSGKKRKRSFLWEKRLRRKPQTKEGRYPKKKFFNRIYKERKVRKSFTVPSSGAGPDHHPPLRRRRGQEEGERAALLSYLNVVGKKKKKTLLREREPEGGEKREKKKGSGPRGAFILPEG